MPVRNSNYGEERVGATLGVDQDQATVTTLADGTYVVAWAAQHAEGTVLWGQRYADNGKAIGPQFRVASLAGNYAAEPSIAAFADSGFVVSWSAYDPRIGTTVVSQSFDSTGVPKGPVVTASQGGGATIGPAIDAYADGYSVVWAESGVTGGTSVDIYLQRYDRAGVPLEPVRQVTDGAAGAGVQYTPDVAADAAGNLMLVWSDASGADGEGYGVFGRLFDVQSQAFGPVFAVAATTAGNQTAGNSIDLAPRVAALAGGGYVVVWPSDSSDGSGWGVVGQRFAADGTTVGGEFLVNQSVTGDQYMPDVVALAGGGFVVGWYNSHVDRIDSTSSSDVYMREYQANGDAVGDESRLASLTNSAEYRPALAALGAGILVAYADYNNLPGTAGYGNWHIQQQLFGDTPVRQADPQLLDFGGTVTFDENAVNAGLRVLDSSVSLADADSANFAGGRLDLYYLDGGADSERLGVVHQGNQAGQVGVDGGSVSVGGVAIGTVTGGSGGSNLRIDFSAAATPAAVAALVRQLGYANSDSGPAPVRSLALQISDGDGGTSVASVVTVQVMAQLDGTPLAYGEETVNALRDQHQYQPSVATLADGGYLIAWTSNGSDGSDGVYLQRFAANGQAAGPQQKAGSVTGYQDVTSVTALSDGGFVVAWQGVSGSGNQTVFAQRYDLDGTPQGATIEWSAQAMAPAVVGYQGGFAAVWSSWAGEGGNSYDIYLRRFDNAGTATDADVRLSATEGTAHAGGQYAPSVAADADGNLLVVWSDGSGIDGSGYGVLGRLIAADGTAGAAFVVNTTTAGNQAGSSGSDYAPKAAWLADGTFVVVWPSDGIDGSGLAVMGQRLGADGSSIGAEFMVNETLIGNQYDVAVTARPGGGFVVAWYNDYYDLYDTSTSSDVYVREYDAAGAPVDGQRKLVSNTSSTEYQPALAAVGDGFVVAYVDYNSASGTPGYGTYDIVQQVFGSPAPRQASPVLGGFGGTVVFLENDVNAGLRVLDADATVTDADSADFAGGRLDLYYVQASETTERLGVVHEGDGAGQIGVSGNTVSYGGVAFGTISGGEHGQNLRIDFTAAAMPAAVAALVRQLGYANSDSSPTPARSLALQVGDGDGGTSAASVVTVQVTAQLDGTPLAYGEEPVNAVHQQHQDRPAAATLSNGDYVIAWSGSGDGTDGVYAQRFAATGQAIGPQQMVDLAGSGYAGEIAVAAVGERGFVVSWEGRTASGQQALLAQIFDGEGVGVGSRILLETNGMSQSVVGYQGGFAAAWSTYTGGGDSYDVYLQRYADDGAPTGALVRVSATADVPHAGAQYQPAVAADHAGNLLVTWTDSNGMDGSGYGVLGRLLAADGTAGDAFVVNSTTTGNQAGSSGDEYGSAVAWLADGTYVVVWPSDSIDGSGMAVMGQRLGADGSAIGAEFMVNESLPGNQYDVAVSARAGGGFVVAWYNDYYDLYDTATSSDVYVREYDAVGNPVDGQRKLVSGTNSTEYHAALTAVGDGYVVAYADYNSVSGTPGYGTYDIVQQLFGSQSPRQASPVLEDFGGTVTFEENAVNAGLRVLDASLTLTDADSADFGGGRLDLYYIAGSEGTERLGIVHQGAAAGEIGVAGNTVSYGGVVIGTISGGGQGANLRIDFAAGAAPDAVAALVRQLGYANSDSSPSPSRTLALQFSDGDGGTSAASVVTVQVTAQLDGTPLGYGEEPVHVVREQQQDQPVIATLEDGDYVIAWTSNGADNTGVYWQRFAPNGQATGDQHKVADIAPGYQGLTGIAALTDGGLVVTWEGEADNSRAVFVQRFDAAGAAQGAPVVVGVQAYAPAVIGYLDGFAAVWSSYGVAGGDHYDIYLQRYDNAGGALGAVQRVSAAAGVPATGLQHMPAVAGDALGNLLITWTDGNGADGSGYGVIGRLVGSDGAAGETFVVNAATAGNQAGGTGSEYGAKSARLVDGTYVVVWPSDSGDGSGLAVRGQRLAADGSRLGEEFLVNETTAGNQYGVALAARAGGGFVVAWHNDYYDLYDTSTSSDVYIREYDAAGSPVDGQRKLASATNSTEYHPALAAVGDGFVVTYADYSSAYGTPGYGTYDVVQQLFGTVPPVVSDQSLGGREDEPLTVVAQRFIDNFQSPNGDPLVTIKITRLPLNGVLLFDGVAVLADQEIGIAALQAGALSFVGHADYHGLDEFRWTGSSGGSFGTATGLVRIELASVNDAPVLAVPLPDQAATQGASFAYWLAAGSFTDVDADGAPVLTATLADGTALPAWLQFYPYWPAFQGVPGAADTGVYTVRVTATDAAGASVYDEFTLTVRASAAPTAITLSNGRVAELSEDGTLVGVLASVDSDVGDTHTYTLLDDAGGRFTLQDNRIMVADAALLDFEADGQHTIVVRSTDRDGRSLEQELVIAVDDILADLVPDAVRFDPAMIRVEAGTALDISWQIRNRDNAAYAGGWVDRVYLDDLATPGIDHLLASYAYTGNLALDQVLTRQANVDVPRVAAGDYRLVVVTDATYVIAEGVTGEANNEAVSATIGVTAAPAPNLQVLSVTAPASALAGRETVVEWVVHNSGNGPTSLPHWTDQVWLSGDDQIDASDILLATVGNASYLNPGESYRGTANITLPAGREGNYRILVRTDAGNTIAEPGWENDNVQSSAVVAVQPIPLGQRPDIAVTDVAAPDQAFSGQRMAMTYRISNLGATEIPADTTDKYGLSEWTAEVFMSTDALLDAGDTLVYFHVSDLSYRVQTTTWTVGQAGAGMVLNGTSYYLVNDLPKPNGVDPLVGRFDVPLPVGVSGEHYFFVRITPNALMNDAFTSNDIAFDVVPVLVRLTPPPDLAVRAAGYAGGAQAGHTLTVTYQVTNDGATSTPEAGWRDALYLSRDSVLDAGDVLLAQPWRSGALDAGASYQQSVDVTLPNGIEGTYYLLARTDTDARVFEVDRANNVAASAPLDIVLRPADLVVTGASAAAGARAGDTLAVEWQVRNQGAGDTIVGTWSDTLILSLDGVVGNGDDIVIGDFHHSGLLNASESYARRELVTLPDYLDGSYQLFVRTDSYERVYEGPAEGNNAVRAITGQPGGVTVVPLDLPDLAVSVPVVGAAASGQPLTVTFTVTNQGAGRTRTGYWQDDIVLSRDDIAGNGDDIWLGSVTRSGALDPLQSYTVTRALALPLDALGDYHLIVTANARGHVSEGGRTDNNQATAALDVAASPSPDLVIGAIGVPVDTVSGRPLALAWTIHNLGDGAVATPWRQAYYLSRDTVLERHSDVYLGTIDTGDPLAAGATLDLTALLNIPKGVAGQYYVIGVADSGNALYERAGEDNNVTVSANPVRIALPPVGDLVAGAITVPDHGTPGARASITYTVHNPGSVAIEGSWDDTLYLSRDRVWDIGDALFARVTHGGGVQAGDSYTHEASGALPGVDSGNYYVIARSDILNQVTETVETNNLSASIDATSLEVEQLALGVADSDTIGARQAVYYRVETQAGETLRFDFDRVGDNGPTELFVSYGEMPQRASFDYRFNVVDAGDQSIVVANTRAGSYYVMAYNAGDAAAGYDIVAQVLDFSITGLSVDNGSNRGAVTVRIDGALFGSGTAARLVAADGTQVAASALVWKDSTEVWATFDLRGKEEGAYDVVLTDGDRSAVLADGFTVDAGEAARIEYGIEMPAALRTGQSGVVRVYYKNVGGTDAAAPLLTVSGNAYLKLPDEAEFGATSRQFLATNHEGPAGLLPPGGEGSFQLVFMPNFANNGEVLLDVSRLDPAQDIDWNTLLDSVRPSDIDTGAWQQIKANIQQAYGSSTTDYQGVLAADASALDLLEGRADTIADLLALELGQATDWGALLRPERPGVLGWGQAFAWEISASRTEDGSVLVRVGDSVERYTRRDDGTYADQRGNVLSEDGGAFQLLQRDGTRIAFNLDGRFASIEDSNGRRLEADYEAGQLRSVTSDAGDMVSFDYNAAGRLVRMADQDGRTTALSYDASGEYLVRVDTVDGSYRYEYITAPGAAQHAISKVMLPDGTARTFTYDAQGHVAGVSNSGAEAVTYELTGANAVTVTNALGESLQALLNERGQVAQVTDTLGRTTQLRYDGEGNLVEIISAARTSDGFSYNADGQLTSAVDALGGTVEYSYANQFGNLSQLRDQVGNITEFVYDRHGNLTGIGHADGSRETFAFDADGNLALAINRRGQEIHYTVDAQGNIVRKEYADGTVATYTYDGRGNMTSATDEDSSTTFGYAGDRLVRVTDGDGRFLAFGYDDAGRRTSMTDQAGNVVAYTYDALGHLAQVRDGAGALLAGYTYDAAGRLQRGDNGNGTYSEYDYDAAGQLASLVNLKADGTVNSRYDYTYDAVGQRTAVTTLDGTTTYAYDAAGQLVGAQLPDGRQLTYRYDAAGNRIEVQDSGAAYTYATNALNQYTATGATTYGYDSDGNLTSRVRDGVTTTYTYDSESRLVDVTTGADSWQYLYDALGQRNATVHNGVRTDYQLDPFGMTNVAAEYDASGALVARYVHGVGLENRIDGGSGAAYYDFDALGSSAGLTGAGGDYLNQYQYLPFGEQLSATETVDNPFEFVGQWGVMRDASGVDYMRNRYYSPETGRFVSADPTGIAGGTNLYTYAANAPQQYVDPEGNFVFLVLVGVVMAVGVPAVTFAPAVMGLSNRTAAYDRYLMSIGEPDEAQREAEYHAAQKLLGQSIKATELAKEAFDAMDLVKAVPKPSSAPTSLINGIYDGWDVKKLVGLIEKNLINGKFANFIVDVNDKLHLTLAQQLDKYPLTHGSTRVIRPSDPNDIIGPKGFGDEHWINAAAPLGYTVRFENQASATAPAQQVTVTLALDADLDPRTVRLGDFGWGDIVIDVPDNVSFYIDRIDLRATHGYLLDVLAGVDVTTGEVFWTLTTIDPATGEIPDDPTIGFLPPNASAGQGEGFMHYTVKVREGVPTGTVIDARATIVFSTQEPIDTPPIFNTIDASLPGSRVLARDDAGPLATTSFEVAWEGADEGAAVASYTVYVADNGGAWTPWLRDTTASQAEFTGERGHTYGFYTVATDNAGNLDTAPGAPDLVVAVSATATGSDRIGPAIAGVSLPAAGRYGMGQTVEFTVTFTEAVVVDTAGGTPALQLNVGGPSLLASYAGGTGTAQLTFRYSVQQGDFDSDGLAIMGLLAGGGIIEDRAGNAPASLALPPSASGVIAIDNAPLLVAPIGDARAVAGTAFAVTVPAATFTDPDGDDVLIWSAAQPNGAPLPAWLAFDAATRTFAGTPVAANIGELLVRVTATDRAGASVADDFLLRVGSAEPVYQTRLIGDAPVRQTGIGGQWDDAWSGAGVAIVHRADAEATAEPWTTVALHGVRAQLLAGGDIYMGDLGVSGQSLETSTVRAEIDGRETLRFNLDTGADAVTLSLSRLFTNDDGLALAESGRVRLLDSLGNVVAEQAYVANRSDGTLVTRLTAATAFTVIELNAGAYDGDAFVYGAYAGAHGGFGAAPATGADGALHGSDFLVNWLQIETIGASAPLAWS